MPLFVLKPISVTKGILPKPDIPEMNLPIEGNIVAKYVYPQCTVYISDACYSNLSESQLEANKENAREIARKIFIKAMLNGKEI
jgi:hypothetical protein